MANIDLKFLGLYSEKSFIKVEVQDYKDGEQKDILITLLDNEGLGTESYIYLDISTAIKFAKTLRTEINKSKEVQDGK